jgi:hypothetical protein
VQVLTLRQKYNSQQRRKRQSNARKTQSRRPQNNPEQSTATRANNTHDGKGKPMKLARALAPAITALAVAALTLTPPATAANVTESAYTTQLTSALNTFTAPSGYASKTVQKLVNGKERNTTTQIRNPDGSSIYTSKAAGQTTTVKCVTATTCYASADGKKWSKLTYTPTPTLKTSLISPAEPGPTGVTPVRADKYDVTGNTFTQTFTKGNNKITLTVTSKSLKNTVQRIKKSKKRFSVTETETYIPQVKIQAPASKDIITTGEPAPTSDTP